MRVLALAPDASSQRAARSLATPRSWPLTGFAESGPGAVWGECKGSAAAPYRAAVDLSGPAYKCSCPSRKLPCKHALALLLLWSAGHVPPGSPPDWAATWLAARAAKSSGTAGPAGTEPADPQAAQRRAEQREARVLSGLDELDQWLRDQVRQGLAATMPQLAKSGYLHWDTIAARMVDAQASGLAERLRGPLRRRIWRQGEHPPLIPPLRHRGTLRVSASMPPAGPGAGGGGAWAPSPHRRGAVPHAPPSPWLVKGSCAARAPVTLAGDVAGEGGRDVRLGGGWG